MHLHGQNQINYCRWQKKALLFHLIFVGSKHLVHSQHQINCLNESPESYQSCSCLCFPCAIVSLRRETLEMTNKPYRCFQHHFMPCCGRCIPGQRVCPCVCMVLEAHCCPVVCLLSQGEEHLIQRHRHLLPPLSHLAFGSCYALRNPRPIPYQEVTGGETRLKPLSLFA